MALSDESDKSVESNKSDDYDDALSYRIGPPVVAMVGVTHLSIGVIIYLEGLSVRHPKYSLHRHRSSAKR